MSLDFIAHPIQFDFALCFIATILLILVTFSTPFVGPFFFLYADFLGGVKFGIWGWCLDRTGECLSKRIGYEWNPQVIAWMTQVLVFYPISAIFSLITTLVLIPSLFSKSVRIYPAPLYSIFVLLSSITSFIAFAFMIALWTVARDRFHAGGYAAEYGPLPWMSLAATILLLVCTIHSGCGTIFNIRVARDKNHSRY